MNFKNRHAKQILFLTCLLVVLSLNAFMSNTIVNKASNYISDNTLTSIDQEKVENPRSSELEYYSKEVVKNGNFSAITAGKPDYWTNTTSGDNRDVKASISSTHANTEINGTALRKEISDKIDDAHESNWKAFNKTTPNRNPDTKDIDNNGFYVSHIWDDHAGDQFVSITWRYNVSMGVDMSEYNITFAFLNATMYANVNPNIDVPTDINCWGEDDSSPPINQMELYDHAYFFVEIADMNLQTYYRVAFNQTNDLGRNWPFSDILTYATKRIESVGTQKDLIYYLTTLLANDPGHDNFAIVVGIEILCADNYDQYDNDIWTTLRIRSLNLTFTAKKIINKDTSLSWNNKGDGIFGANKAIINATLNFEHYINCTSWLGNTSSSNSEIRIIVNNIQLPETIKLSSINNTWQKAKSSGFDVSNFVYVNTTTNISITVYIGDTFQLDKKITVSIDNVSLIIWYSIYTAPHETKYDLFLEGQNRTLPKSINVPLGEIVNITFIYKNDTDNSNFIDGAKVELYGTGITTNLTKNADFNFYNRTINTTLFGLGDKYLWIKASKRLYETQEFQITISVIKRPAVIDKIYLNNLDRTLSKKIENLPSGTPLNITISYVDDDTGNFIQNATVELQDTEGRGGFFNETLGFNQHNYTYNTTNLNRAAYVLTVIASAENYSSVTEQLIAVIDAAGSNYSLYLNGSQRPSDTISVTIDQFLYINFTYTKWNETAHKWTPILGAMVDINGSGISKILHSYGGDNYSTIINTTKLNPDLNILHIYAQRDGYISKIVTLNIIMIQRQTVLKLYVNGTYMPALPPDYMIAPNDLAMYEWYNITASYMDVTTDKSIMGANVNVSLKGQFISERLNPVGNNYTYRLNSTHEDLREFNMLLVIAEAENYEPQTVRIKLSIVSIETDYEFFLNRENKTGIDKSIKLMWSEDLNVTVKFLDKNGNHISLATVDINGTGISELLSPNGSQYTIILNTKDDFSVGIKYCAIVAQKTNYEAQTIVFKVEVIDRTTDYQVILNGVNSTTAPSIDLPIGELLEIKIKYIDNTTKNHINVATVNITGEGILDSLEESATLKEYSITISSSDLDIGVRYLTIFAQKSNYVSQSIKLTVEVKRIRTEITTVSGNMTITIRPGENVNISIVLNNLDFGGRIKGARVNYTWELGQGALYDLDNDGVYQITLENVPAGTYTLTITVYASDNYDFERFRITVNAIRPEQEVFWIYVLAGTGIAAAIGSGSYLIAYQKVLKYPKSIRKLRKFRSKLKRKSITGVEISSRESTITSLYQEELGKVSKLIKGKPEVGPKELPDKIIDKISEKQIEKVSEVKSDKTPDNSPNPI